MKILLHDNDNDDIEIILKGRITSKKVQDIFNKLKEIEMESTITYRVNDKTYYEDLNLVEFFIYEDSYVYAFINGEKQKITHSLYQLENIENFIRISKQTIVNKKYVKYIEIEFNGNYYLYMKNNKKFILTRNYVKKFKESMR
ncbi:MAG: LytTR family DNA-binding domain-containing protein [Lachnospirales bacterium]